MDDAAAIRATIAPWIQAGLDRNWDAMLALCTHDVVFSPPGEPSVSGNNLRKWLEGFPVIKAFNFGFDRIDVSGDLAAGVGRGTWTVVVNDREVSAPFKFADVFRKDSNGHWRYAHVIWNLDGQG